MRKTIAIISIGFFLGGIAACRRSATKVEPSAPVSGQSDPEAARREAQALVDKGRGLYQNDEDKEAVKTLEQAVKLDPSNAEGHLWLGLALNALDQVEDAKDSLKKSIELYKKVVEADPKNSAAFFNMGEAYKFFHRDEEAAQAYRQAIRLKPDDEEAQYQLGESLTRLARYPEAVTAFQKALDMDPNDFRASDGLDNAKEGSKRITEGKKHQEDMLKKQQEDANKNANAAASPGAKPGTKQRPN